MLAQDVLDFWFLPRSDPGYGKARPEWFRKDPAFDAVVAGRFGALIAQAVAGGLREWDLEGPEGRLARIPVLDQFTRNAHRDTPLAFAGDTLALAAARQLVDSGADRQLEPQARAFAYMPFEHAEDARMQECAVELFGQLAREHEGFVEMLDYAHRHRGVIARFGRFPHRNPILGRASTPDELQYRASPAPGSDGGSAQYRRRRPRRPRAWPPVCRCRRVRRPGRADALPDQCRGGGALHRRRPRAGPKR
ncbi:DUF924 family protein [Massilia sp. Dwa41.01b]|uniref:DUF924 family protein n=1 Tax=Massilia sp. Dwa41.01b TaxID=2709302 RepID=UPI00280536D1|nr:DUF924 family protein [Massilia sp. Dwa41.01b]